jgi:protein SCO1/2
MKTSWRTLLPVAALLLVAAVGLGLRFMGDSGAPTIGGPFALVDQSGRAVTDQDYRGRYMLIFFGYTFCPDVCPTTLSTVAGALEKLPQPARAKLVPLFVTIDPGRDTPDVMKAYVEAFGQGIQGLSGSAEQIAKVSKAYRVYAAKVKGPDPATYTMDHSAILYLMSPDGKLAAHFVHGISIDDLAAGLAKHLGA